MKVSILTMFNGISPTYSLVNVVEEQLTMLLKAGHQVQLLVSEDCPDNDRYGIFGDSRIEWVKITNRLNGDIIHWKDYSQPTGTVHATFHEEADVIAQDYIRVLADSQVCFMHDIHYQGWHLVHNVAIRQAQEQMSHIRFLAFTHSVPVNRPLQTNWPFSARYSPMPRTLYIYPTQSGLPALARQYAVSEGKCRAVNNSLNGLMYVSEEVKALASCTELISSDIVIVYPGRLTPGKKFEKVAMLAGAIKKQGEKSVQLVFCDFPSMDIPSDSYKQLIVREGVRLGLASSDIIFTSDHGYPQGFPRQGVLELFQLSNLFICPSFSESFGLTVLEAASRGNFIVLNEAVPALEELGKQLHSYFMRWDARNFGFNSQENYHPSEEKYLEDHANKIITIMRGSPSLFAKTTARQRYSPEWIWKHQLEPLLE